MRTLKLITALGLAGVLMCAVPFSAMAQVEKPESMDDETWLRLQDDVLEYDEIGNLVEYYNPAYRQVVQQIEINVNIYEDAARGLREAVKENMSEAGYAKDVDPVMYAVYMGTAQGYRQAAKSFEKVAGSIKSSTRHQLGMMRKMTTSGVQQMMNGYHQALASKELVDTLVELSQAAYDSTVTQSSIGMATSVDVETALKSLQSAQGQQKALEDSMRTVRQNLCLMTGWSYNADIAVGDIPEPDVSGIDGMNPANDLTRAIGNNYTLIELRGTSGKGTANYNQKMRTTDEIESKIKTQLETLYQEILEKKTAYEAAHVAFQGAQITMNGNDLKYQMGMLGRLEYLQLKMAYLQQKAALKTAQLNLTQAMENYRWAVEGLADVD